MSDTLTQEVIVDASAIGKVAGDLTGRLNLVDLLDMCALMEAVSLHERIRMVGRLPDKFRELLAPLFDSGVLIEHNQTTRIANLNEPQPMHGSRQSLLDAWHETGRLVGAERQLGTMALPMLRQRRYYMVEAHVQEDHSICDLFGHYSELSEALQQARESSRIATASYISVPIPPIALEVLKISRNAGEFIPRSLEVREGFEPLRMRLSDLRSALGDPGLKPQAKLRLVSQWAKSWATLRRYQESAQYMEVATTSIGLLDQRLTRAGEWHGSLRVSDLVANLARIAERSLNEWRVRILHQTAKRYLHTPDALVAVEVERIFGHARSAQVVAMVQATIASPAGRYIT